MFVPGIPNGPESSLNAEGASRCVFSSLFYAIVGTKSSNIIVSTHCFSENVILFRNFFLDIHVSENSSAKDKCRPIRKLIGRRMLQSDFRDICEARIGYVPNIFEITYYMNNELAVGDHWVDILHVFVNWALVPSFCSFLVVNRFYSSWS